MRNQHKQICENQEMKEREVKQTRDLEMNGK